MSDTTGVADVGRLINVEADLAEEGAVGAERVVDPALDVDEFVVAVVLVEDRRRGHEAVVVVVAAIRHARAETDAVDVVDQFGLAFRMPIEALDTEFGLYWQQLYSRTPVISPNTAPIPRVRPMMSSVAPARAPSARPTIAPTMIAIVVLRPISVADSGR